MTTQTESHISIGRRLIRHADEQFDSGDFLQTSEKAWGAAVQFIKAHAESRGLPHSSHYDLRQVANHLAIETGVGRIRELFSICESVHANYYEAYMREDDLEASLTNVRELISMLERVPMPLPSEESLTQPRNRRERQFFVTRDGSI